jgi:regulator of sigma E protease
LMNLLPLPALDGGRLVFIVIAMIRRRPVSERVEAVVHTIGFLLLLGILLLATFGDIHRQLGRSSPTPSTPPADTGGGPSKP